MMYRIHKKEDGARTPPSRNSDSRKQTDRLGAILDTFKEMNTLEDALDDSRKDRIFSAVYPTLHAGACAVFFAEAAL